MKNKKAQFYLITIIILVVALMGFITISNFIKQEEFDSLKNFENEIQTERDNVLDYISNQALDTNQIKEILANFSNEFIIRIGEDKDILFIFGNTSELSFVGNRLEGTNLTYDVGNGVEEITDIGDFDNDFISTDQEITIILDEINYEFEIFDGQNIYYLVKYDYNEGVHIING